MYVHLSVTYLQFLQLYKNDRLSVSSTENSAIESHPQTVCQSVKTAHSVYKNDRLSVSSTENSAIESQPQTVSQNSSFSEMTTENTDRVSVNACQDTDTLVQPCLATALSS